MPTLPRLVPPHSSAFNTSLPFRPLSEEGSARSGMQRLRTWDIPAMFHCSIIGTCLTTGELRQLLIRAGQEDARTATDHALHGRGVRLAAQRDQAARLLNKALDKRHETSIRRIGCQMDEEALRALWRECFDRGDIAGPYWALISHPASSPAFVREIFGEVHMLSHLVGSASRLDLARLTRLERDLAQEKDKSRRQQARLKAAAAERIGLQQRIGHLEASVVQARASAFSLHRAEESSPLMEEDASAARADVLARRLSETEAHCRALQRELEQLQDLSHSVLRENEALEAAVAVQLQTGKAPQPPSPAGPLLYVGGRRNLFDHLRAYAASRNVDLLLHDGGMEDSTTMLPALVGQASTVLFPVDHISHAAVGLVKRLCRQQAKPYLPLRSAGLASFLAAISGGGAYIRS